MAQNGTVEDGAPDRAHAPSQRYLSTRGEDYGVCLPPNPLPALPSATNSLSFFLACTAGRPPSRPPRPLQVCVQDVSR